MLAMICSYLHLEANLEQSDGLDVVGLVQGESVVDSSRDDQEIAGFNGKADPFIRRGL